jgi:hypothetical protein
MSIEAMKQALENLDEYYITTPEGQKLVTSLRQAIAEEALNKKAENARELGLTYEQEPTCKQGLQVWVISNSKGAGQFSWEPQDEKFWTRMVPANTHPPKRVVFPTMLRKMWSGTEVQAWLDEHVNKEKNT